MFRAASIEFVADLGIFHSKGSAIDGARYISRLDASFRLRTLKHRDLSDVAALLSQCFYPQEGWQSWFNPILQMGIFHDLQSRYSVRLMPFTSLIGAQVVQGSPSESELIGTVEVTLKSLSPWLPLTPSVPYISNLAVAPQCRCQGVGKQLLFACEEMVRQWGHHRLYLHVMDDNTPARRLYAKAGYQLVDSPPAWSNLFFSSSKRLLLCKRL